VRCKAVQIAPNSGRSTHAENHGECGLGGKNIILWVVDTRGETVSLQHDSGEVGVTKAEPKGRGLVFRRAAVSHEGAKSETMVKTHRGSEGLTGRITGGVTLVAEVLGAVREQRLERTWI